MISSLSSPSNVLVCIRRLPDRAISPSMRKLESQHECIYCRHLYLLLTVLTSHTTTYCLVDYTPTCLNALNAIRAKKLHVDVR